MKISQLFEFEAPKQSPLNVAVTPQMLDAIERKLDALYKNINVDVDFSRHFAERLSDARNVKPITVGELVKIFTDAYKKYANVIRKSPYEYQAVLTDLSSLLNVPFVLNWDSKHKEGELKAKTIMRKPDFYTSNPKLVVEWEDFDWLRAFWFNAKTGQKIDVHENSEHIDDVVENPEKYGLSPKNVSSNWVDIDGKSKAQRIIKLMLDIGWVRCAFEGDDGDGLDIEATSLSDARKALSSILKRNILRYAYITVAGKDITLSTIRDLKNFANTGKIDSNPKLVVESLTDNYYMREGCGIYAVALSIVNPGGQIWIISNKDGEPWSKSIPFEVTHVVYRNAGKLFDVKGQRTMEAICADFDIDPNEYPSPITTKGPFTPEEFMKKFMGSSDTKPLYGSKKDVEELVKKLQNKKPEEVLDEAPIHKQADFKSDEGKFSIYDIEKTAPRNRSSMFTVYKSKDGYIVRNAILPDDLKRKGIATQFYIDMNKESIAKTGKPLRSTQPRKLISGEIVHELSPEGIALWDSFVSKGLAKKLGDKNYRFITSQLKEAQQSAVYVKEIPDVYRKLPVLGKGFTSIVMDKGDGNVLMFTRDDIKKDWLTKDWGIKIGNEVAMLDGFAHKKMAIRNMPIYVIELPKLFKLDTNNKRILKTEMMKWDRCYSEARMKNRSHDLIMIDATNSFIEQFPDSPLIPIMEFMQNYSGYVNMDLAPRNTLQDAQGNMIFVDPLVSKELLDVMYNRG